MNELAKTICIVFILFLFSNTYSQWYLTSGDILDCDFPVQDTGYVVGKSGTIRKTFDGGETWHLLHSGTINDVKEVHFFTANTGYAFTGDEIITTNDGGYSWDAISNPIDNEITDVFCLDKNNWFLIDLFGRFYKTTNGGADWSEPVAFESAINNDYRNIYFLDQNNGFIVGNYLYTTTNGGNNWSKKDNYVVSEIYFLNQDTGFIFGSGQEYITTNGGTIWNEIDISGNVEKLDFTNNGVGYYYGSDKVYKTTNYGNSWDEKYTFETDKNSIAVLNENSCIVVGNYASIFKTIDNGVSWDTISQYPTYTLNLASCTFIDSSKVIAVSYRGAILMSYDAGVTWNVKFENDELGVYTYDVFFVDADTGFILNEDNILKTMNGGESWTNINIDVSGFNGQIYFINDYKGFIIGEWGEIHKTTDGGFNWEAIESNTSSNLYDIKFTNDSTGFIVGENDAYLYTNDTGNTWISPYISPLFGDHSAIWFHDSSKGCIGGSRLYKTNDGGKTWINYSNPDDYINSFCFFGEDTIFSVSNEDFDSWINISVDSGLTWGNVPWGAITTTFKDIACYKNKEILAVGEYTLKPALSMISPSYDHDDQQLAKINNIEISKEFAFTPNPVRDNLYISAINPNNSIQNIEIIDIYGRILLKQNFNNSDVLISLSFLKTGNYYILINSKYHLKILKE